MILIAGIFALAALAAVVLRSGASGALSGRRRGLALMAIPAVALALMAVMGVNSGGGDGGGDWDLARAFFLHPSEGVISPSPVPVAVAATDAPGDSHFHVTVDRPCVTKGQTIPSDENHHHLAGGEGQLSIRLPAGEHTLCVQLSDKGHVARGVGQRIVFAVAGGA